MVKSILDCESSGAEDRRAIRAKQTSPEEFGDFNRRSGDVRIKGAWLERQSTFKPDHRDRIFGL